MDCIVGSGGVDGQMRQREADAVMKLQVRSEQNKAAVKTCRGSWVFTP